MKVCVQSKLSYVERHSCWCHIVAIEGQKGEAHALAIVTD